MLLTDAKPGQATIHHHHTACPLFFAPILISGTRLPKTATSLQNDSL
jgi:hypothetical protein